MEILKTASITSPKYLEAIFNITVVIQMKKLPRCLEQEQLKVSPCPQILHNQIL